MSETVSVRQKLAEGVRMILETFPNLNLIVISFQGKPIYYTFDGSKPSKTNGFQLLEWGNLQIRLTKKQKFSLIEEDGPIIRISHQNKK